MAVSGGHPRRRRLALAAALLALAPALLVADYRDAYRAGLDAAAKRQWAEAARQMRLAIAERPEAAGGVLGLRRYTPHYHLGVALSELGDCQEALTAFDGAEAQGKLDRNEVQDLERRRQGCRQRLSRTAEAVAEAQREIDGAAAAAFEVGRVENNPVMRGVWGQGSPSYQARQQPAMAKLAEARAALAAADRGLDPEAAAAAATLAQEARRELEALASDAGQRRDELVAQVERERSEMAKAAAAAQKDLDFFSRTLSPLPPDIARRAAELREVLAQAAQAGPEVPLPELQALQDRLRKATRELRSAVRPPPEDLQQAARAYFAGDYAGALAILGQRQHTDPRAAGHACLLRAAALHGTHLATAAAGEDPAIAELRRCQQLRVKPRLAAGAFPPTFQALHAGVAAEPRPTP